MTRTFSGKKLGRLPREGMVKGVCAGIAHYLDVPVKLVRLITVLSMLFGLFFITIRRLYRSDLRARSAG